jgi:uncharacterized membrane protein YfcA
VDAVVLVLAGLAAGWINTVAGAGGVIAMPALILWGLPAPVANGTFRVAVVLQSLVGGAGYVRAKALPRVGLVATVLPAVIGALGGALVATRLTARAVEILLIVAFAVVLVSAFHAPKPGDPEHPPRLGARAVAGMLVAGFYGGLVQTGVGLVLLAVLTAIIGHDMLGANAVKVIATLVFNVVALVVFALAGDVDWVPGLILGAGSMVGAWLGVKFAVKRGHNAIRVVVIVVTVVAAVVVIVR